MQPLIKEVFSDCHDESYEHGEKKLIAYFFMKDYR